MIAITGTNAKSTVTALVSEMAKASGLKTEIGGNFGTPVLDLLHDGHETELYVLELSSFQLETTYSLKSSVATVLNLSPDHMDRYGSLQEYRKAKLRIYENSATVVCNKDDAMTDIDRDHKIYFTAGEPGENEFGIRVEAGSTYLAHGNDKLIDIKELPVMGKHYQVNALAALALGTGYGLPMDAMLQVLRQFNGLPHRCEFVRERNGVRWINDSKGTNVGATQAAIAGLGSHAGGKLIMIMGGLGKNADFTTLLPVLKQYVSHVVLIGEAAKEMAQVFRQTVPVSFADSMDEAVSLCDKEAAAGDTVLLSPACASFDMFKSFEHRGQVFTEVVKNLR